METTKPEIIESIPLRKATLKLIEWPAKEENKEKNIRAQKAKKVLQLSFYDKKTEKYVQTELSRSDLEVLKVKIPEYMQQI